MLSFDKFYFISRLADSTIVEVKKGELIGYDGYRHKKSSKVHVVVTTESLPLSVVIDLGDMTA
jgi:hypothetical protein